MHVNRGTLSALKRCPYKQTPTTPDFPRGFCHIYIKGKRMVIVDPTATVADLDEALTNMVATMQKSDDRAKLMQNIDALLDARLGTQ